jgi:hypothetical protein
MDCIKNGNEIECVICTSYKVPLSVKPLLERIAELLGKFEFKKEDDGIFVLEDGTKIICEEAEMTWSDRCVSCKTV